MLNSVDPIMTAIRSIFIVFDACVYYFVNFGFEMLFNIATFNIVDRKMIFDLISRVQLIIGIFMLFQLAMTIIKGIVNPDSFTDSKSGGAGNVIMRIIVSLVLLALLVPLNISSPKNEYEKQLNNNGVLFGTLYSLQYRILTNDTLGRIIIGDDSTNYTAGDEDGSKLSDFANNFTTTVVKSFYTLNTDDEGNYVCGDGWDEAYANEKMTAHEVIANGIRVCGDDSWPTWIKELADHSFVGQIVEGVAGVKYSLSMSYIASTVVGVVLLVLLAMMIFNVATRVFKLVALQILAPIPVISYMDPKGSKDSAFNSWLKLLGTTYLELFIQLGVIYFAISIIHSFMERFPMLAYTAYRDIHAGEDAASFVIGAVTGETMVKWTFIIMTIALFIFAKDAPKFFKQMLGMKDDGKGFFSAFGNAMGLGATAVAAIGSFNAGRSGSRLADLTNHDEQYANRFGNRAKHIAAGIVNMGKGLSAGSAAASESKGNGMAKTMAAWKAMNAINEETVQRGASGSTFVGRTMATGAKIVQGSGNTGFDKETRRISQLKDIEKSGKDLFTYLEGKGKTDGADYNVTTAGIEALGGKSVTGSVNEFIRAKAAALADEQRTGKPATFDFGGMKNLNAHDAVATKIEEELTYAAGHEWAYRQDFAQYNYDHLAQLKIKNPRPVGTAPDVYENQLKDMVKKEVETIVRKENPSMTDVEVTAEVDRRCSSFKETDIGYSQKKDTYNESVKGADFEEAPELVQEYSTTTQYDENGAVRKTVDVSNLKKRFKKAGGMAVRHESDASYKKQKTDFAATKKNG